MNQEKGLRAINIYVNQEILQQSFPVEKTAGIYKITFKNGFYYIRSALNLRARCMDHLSKLKNNKHENPIMQNIFLKYPSSVTFSIIEIVDKKHLITIEQKHLNENYGKQYCININPVANRPPSAKGRVHSEEHKKRLSEKMKGRVLSKEWRDKIGRSNKSLINLVKRRRNLYNKRYKEVLELERQRASLIEYFI